MKIEKRAGWDWTVSYRDGDDPEILTMAVFGCASIEDAIKDARESLGGFEDEDAVNGNTYEILSVSRDEIRKT
jgi:hypothetical protein